MIIESHQYDTFIEKENPKKNISLNLENIEIHETDYYTITGHL